MHLAPALERLTTSPDDQRRLGAFKLVRQLGSGGFAPVWLATEVYGTKELRTAALKLFSLEGPDADREALSRVSAAAQHKDQVIDEARALCRVEHPNIVRFYAIALDEERGVIGLAMEYVRGTPLDKRLEHEGKLSPADTIAIGIAVASALAAVHAAGIVHRDVKPANIVESAGVHKLIDFGIAAAEIASEPAPRARTKRVVLDDLPLDVVGTKMSMLAAAYTVRESDDASADGVPFLLTGTVGYIDPNCVAERSSATPASDLYGLGATLYECLTGLLPAQAMAPPGTGLRGEVLDGRARAASIRVVAPDLPAPLADLIDRLLDPDPASRPHSAEEVVSALKGPTSADTTSLRPARARMSGRSRAAIVGAAVVAVGLGAFALRGRFRAPPVSETCNAADPNDCNVRCERGNADSCFALARMYMNGSGVARDEARAAALFRTACEAKHASGCQALGHALEMGTGVAVDATAALVMHERACAGGNAQGCNSAGRLIALVDPALASERYRQSCDLGYGVGCSNLALMYELGSGVPKDLARARELDERACKDVAGACGQLAGMLADGIGGEKDEARAVALYRKACEAGNQQACLGLGVMLQSGRGAPKDAVQAAALFKRACEASDADACANLGALHLVGDGVSKDEARAVMLYQRACDGDLVSACRSLAELYAKGLGTALDVARARSLYAQACDAGDPLSCSKVANMEDAGAIDATASAAPPRQALRLVPTAQPSASTPAPPVVLSPPPLPSRRAKDGSRGGAGPVF